MRERERERKSVRKENGAWQMIQGGGTITNVRIREREGKRFGFIKERLNYVSSINTTCSLL